MSYNILSIEPFDRQLKRLQKKYPSLKSEMAALIQTLEENPFRGVPLVNSCYKIRVAIAGKGRGKSGGARVISYVQIVENTVYLLSIYDKSKAETIADKQIDNLLKLIE